MGIQPKLLLCPSKSLHWYRGALEGMFEPLNKGVSDVEFGRFIASVSLLLLFRALEFFCAFTSLLVSEYRSGSIDDSLLTVVYLAYDQSLKQHHNWFMRATFYVSPLRYCKSIHHCLREDC